MRATHQDRERLEAQVLSLVEQLKALGAVKIILFGSLARGQISLFSDIDLLALFDRDEPSRELTRWVYQNIQASESVDILAYNPRSLQKMRERPFFRQILREGKVVYDRLGA